MAPLEYPCSVRAALRPLRASFALSAALLLCTAACEDDTLTTAPPMADAGTPFRCVEDSECPNREACNALTGICFPLDACDDDRPCPNPDQICEDEDGDGYNDCVFERCEDVADCSDLVCPDGQVPQCVAGGCICGAPCQGGCPAAQGCCIPEDTCYDLPDLCMGLTCNPGEILSVTSSGAWDTGQCEVLGENCNCEPLPPLALGDVGLHSALAHDGRNAIISAYNIDYGDLMFGVVQPDGVTIDWEFVDGVPTSTDTITGSVDGPRGGQGEAGTDVGLYTDIAADGMGRPHIVYHDRDALALKYAVGTTSGWDIHEIESGGSAGLYSSLAFGSDGRPIIAYLTAREGPSSGPRFSTLRVAIANVEAPTSVGDWTIRDVESMSLLTLGCADQCNPGEVCRASDLSCVTPEPNRCAGGCASGERCLDGRCSLVDPLPPFTDLPLARGLWPSLAVRPDGSLLIAYHDRTSRSLKLASVAGPNLTSGAIDVVEIEGGPNSDTGHQPSLFITPGGEIYLAYLDSGRRTLKYRNLSADLSTLALEEVEVGLGSGNTPGGDLIGADPALVVDSTGQVRVAYQNATTGELRYATRLGEDNWATATLRGNEDPYEGSFGFYTDQTLDAARVTPLVSTYRYLLSGPPGNGLELLTPP